MIKIYEFSKFSNTEEWFKNLEKSLEDNVEENLTC